MIQSAEMNFAIRYLTEYHYKGKVADNLNALRVRPATTSTQRVDDFHVRQPPAADAIALVGAVPEPEGEGHRIRVRDGVPAFHNGIAPAAGFRSEFRDGQSTCQRDPVRQPIHHRHEVFDGETREADGVRRCGARDHRGQAALQGLYNPDRLRGPMVRENGAWKAIDWDAALTLVSLSSGLAERFGLSAEAAIGLAILVTLFRNRRTINVADLDSLKG